jgi:ubiquinone/menaquinone biosynthesis C-methylase UbiE
MCAHVCPWWGGYFIDNPLRRWIHNPRRILAPCLRPGMTVLDFGCGMGQFAIAMAGQVGDAGQVIAADVQPQMLEVLRRRAAKAGVADRVRTHLCPPDAIGLDVPLDFALAFYSMHEVPDQRQTLTELHTLLRPGGRLLLIEPRGHVSEADFRRTLAVATEIGFRLHDGPRVHMSRSAILEKGAA